MRPQIGDVCYPNPIRCVDGELPIQCVVHDDRRPSTINAGLLLVADLRLNAGKAGQPCNAVFGYDLPHIDQIIVDFAVAVDLTAVFPRLLHQLGLALIFLRTVT